MFINLLQHFPNSNADNVFWCQFVTDTLNCL